LRIEVLEVRMDDPVQRGEVAAIRGVEVGLKD